MYPPWAPGGQDGCGALELLVQVCSVGREGRELGQEHASHCNQRLAGREMSANRAEDVQGQQRLLQKALPDKPIHTMS